MTLVKSLVASAAMATILINFVVTPVSASSQGQVSDVDLSEVSPYVEAETEAEAMNKLDQLEKDNSGGMSAQAASARFGPCKLYPESFHTRDSGDHDYGGVKPVTVCTEKVTGIKMASQLRYKNALMWVKTGVQVTQTAQSKDLKVGKYKYKDKKDWAVKFQQKNMNYLCKGSKEHNWSASTIGRLRYQGRTLWARVYASPRSANCGPH